MKKIFFILNLVFLIGCITSEDNYTYDLNGNWKVSYFIKNNVKIIKTNQNTWNDIDNIDITANFSISNTDNTGIISGIRATNKYTGSFKLFKNNRIKFKDIGLLTKINEPTWTNLYQLDLAESFELINETLIIYYNNKKNAIVFVRA